MELVPFQPDGSWGRSAEKGKHGAPLGTTGCGMELRPSQTAVRGGKHLQCWEFMRPVSAAGWQVDRGEWVRCGAQLCFRVLLSD